MIFWFFRQRVGEYRVKMARVRAFLTFQIDLITWRCIEADVSFAPIVPVQKEIHALMRVFWPVRHELWPSVEYTRKSPRYALPTWRRWTFAYILSRSWAKGIPSVLFRNLHSLHTRKTLPLHSFWCRTQWVLFVHFSHVPYHKLIDSNHNFQILWFSQLGLPHS